MRRVFLLSLVLLLPCAAQAQTTTQTLEWDHLSVSLATVQTYVTTLKINAGAATLITPNCLSAGPNVHCTNPIVAKSGDVVTVTVVSPGGVSANGSLTYNTGNPPAGPTNIVITIKITVP